MNQLTLACLSLLFISSIRGQFNLLEENAFCNPIVHTQFGDIKCSCVQVSGEWERMCLGIPYAKPPINGLRFKYPVIHDTQWNGTYDATNFAPSCSEPLLGNDARRCDQVIVRSEDCLYLNIWSPAKSDATRGGKPMPVLVWIHGGGLIMLSGNDCMINSGKICSIIGGFITVTFNFRLGAFGFLYSATDDMPGNMGLMDMVAALKWIHENIADFGGDPNRIVLGGLSSGAYSAGTLWMSGHCNNYVSGLLLHSGAPGDPLMESRQESLSRFNAISQIIGCRKEDQKIDSNVINCVKTAPAASLILAQVLPENRNPPRSDRPEAFLPTLDGNFLPTTKGELWTSRRWPKNKWILMSRVTDEGHIMRPHMHGATFLTQNDLIETIEYVAKMMIPGEQLENGTLDLIKSYGLGFENATASDMEIAFRNLIGDWYIICPMLRFAEANLLDNRIYSMKFTYTKNSGPSAERYGSRHGIDIYYCFGGPFRDLMAFDEVDREMSKTMIQIWGDFVNKGSSYWQSYERTSSNKVLHYQREVNLKQTITVTSLDSDVSRCEIWKNYYEK